MLQKNKKLRAFCLLLPSLAGVIVFYIIPAGMSFNYAFFDNTVKQNFVFLDNFLDILHNEFFITALYNTITFSLFSVFAIVVFSFSLSVMIVMTRLKSSFVIYAFLITIALPSSTITMIWKFLFGEAGAFLSLFVIYMWKYIGINIILFVSALNMLPRELIESSVMDGANTYQQISYVIIPGIFPSVVIVTILSFMNSFRIYRESYLLYGAYPPEEIYMLQNYMYNHFEKLNYQNISSAAVVFFSFVNLAVGLLLLIDMKAHRNAYEK